MDFLGRLMKEFIDVIEWNQPAQSETMAWRFPRYDNEIKNGAKLVVREGQAAVFVNMGQLADSFSPGLHTLETKNLPILSKLLGWPYGFQSPFKADAYFVTTRRFTDNKWGTQNPVMLRDKEFGPLRIRAFGTYAVQVTNPPVFLRQLLATSPSFEAWEITGQLRGIIVTRVTDALASSGIPALDMAANLDELSKFIQTRITPDFEEMGISVPNFLIENISLPPNVEEMLDKRTSMGIVGNLDAYMRFQTAEAIGKAAENPSGVAGVGAGLGAGLGMANQMMSAMGPAAGAQAVPPPLPGAAPFYAGIGGRQAGPFDMAALQGQVASGAITRDTLVWRAGMAAWTPASQVPDLAGLFPPPLPPA